MRVDISSSLISRHSFYKSSFRRYRGILTAFFEGGHSGECVGGNYERMIIEIYERVSVDKR